MELPEPVQEFLKNNQVAILATLATGDEYPHLTPVYYAFDKQTRLYFPSKRNSQKLKNIQGHPQITVSITNPQSLTTLELRGLASEVKSEDEIFPLVSKLMTVASEASETAFPPILSLGSEPTEIVKFSIKYYSYSNFHGKTPIFLRGTLKEA